MCGQSNFTFGQSISRNNKININPWVNILTSFNNFPEQGHRGAAVNFDLDQVAGVEIRDRVENRHLIIGGSARPAG